MCAEDVLFLLGQDFVPQPPLYDAAAQVQRLHTNRLRLPKGAAALTGIPMGSMFGAQTAVQNAKLAGGLCWKKIIVIAVHASTH